MRLTARAICSRVARITERMASNPPERREGGSGRDGVTFIVPCFNEDP
jgi:hypothetical protein